MSQASRTQKKQRKFGVPLGIAGIAAGITIIVLLAAFVWIPGARSESPSTNSLIFSSFPDGTNLMETPSIDAPFFVGGGAPISTATVIGGVAVISGSQPVASVVFRPPQQAPIIGQSIEIECLVQNNNRVAIRFNSLDGVFAEFSVTGKTFSMTPQSVTVQELNVDDKITFIFDFVDVTSCVVKIATTKETKTLTGLLGSGITASTVLASITFGIQVMPTTSFTSWKLLSIKTSWNNAFAV